MHRLISFVRELRIPGSESFNSLGEIPSAPVALLILILENIFLLGLSKGNARVEISASFFFRSATVCNYLINTHARRFY